MGLLVPDHIQVDRDAIDRSNPDAEMRAAPAAAPLRILASMWRAYAEKTGRFRCRHPMVLHL